MTEPYRYAPFGLLIASEMELPELPVTASRGRADITLQVAGDAATAARAAGGAAGEFRRAPGGGTAMSVPGAGAVHVRHGREIAVAPEPGGDPGYLRLIVIGSGLGMALHQNGRLVMHGATVLRDGAARLIVGPSAAGKSTLAAALADAGFAVLGDDTMPIDWQGGRPVVVPGARVVKLWADAIRRMGRDPADYPEVATRTGKHFVPGVARASGPVPLEEVIVLDAAPECARAELGRLSGLAALAAVSDNVYRPEFADLIGRRGALFRQCAELVRAVPVQRLARPWDLARLDDTVRCLDRHWAAPAPSRG